MNDMNDMEQLLNDDQMMQFITQGYLVLHNDLPGSLHKKVMQRINEVLVHEGNPGNNILPRVPDIQAFFETPVVKGALTSVLGPDYYLHPHRHCHYNSPGNQNPGGGEWHKDGYWSAMRSHRPWWAMIFYYTQDITTELGPTAIMPGSQYNEKFPGHEKEFLLPTGPAGTMVLVHFDLWHKASQNVSALDRYMLKFQFARRQTPSGPSWNNTSKTMPVPEAGSVSRTALWESIWNWMRGEQAPVKEASREDNSVIELARLAQDASEDDALNAVYELAGRGEVGVRELLDILDSGSNLAALRAAYGIQAAGEIAVQGLIERLRHADDRRRALACFSLGMLSCSNDRITAALTAGLSDDSQWVRRNAAEALGMLVNPSAEAVSALAHLLEISVRSEKEEAQTESTNAYSPNQDYIKNKLGYTAALSLLRIGKHGEAVEVVTALEEALSSNDRYVRAYAFEALSQLRIGEAVEVLLRYYRTSRWCPDTTKASMF
ncbi:HEAT repeat domain-containing protein [Paenibacillus solisilvae]|uniref:HEAT repeat domain-containing protein n=1 Tax=Paenibacillus solisilvae TaxID=2486751 RepID=A0ABW0VXE7_9BACL